MMSEQLTKQRDEDLLLLLQLKNGNYSAFDLLYQRYSKMLYANILRLVKDSEMAKELLQDLFLKIWERRNAIDTTKSFKSFLFTIARNAVYDYFRKVSLDKKLMTEMISRSVELYSHTEEDISFKEKSACLAQAINTLPPQSRQVYQLCKIEGLSHEEISKQLGISISTINNHMVKANKLVKEFLYRNSDLAITLIVVSFLHQLK
ncbi:RNA polymerase sigma factor [Pedobacter paludis]|uniref:RNA polymerase sigma-70 factor n=1 Tax=Pedobacter paludis TaxID=2203212 RepID=A0A317F135_9SPHI|nr:RNA polymerase sigma-70 factor [Pedobacter paludis]PWS32864.1 hypothetical protein DF947_07280 [Pedobacter paludis]